MSSQNQLKAYKQGPSQGATQGYQQVPQPGSPTYTEAWALIEAARRMAVAIESGPINEIKTRNTVREALRLNWRLWTIFQAELTVGNGPIPDEIRLNMLSLCRFVDSHTIETMSEPSPEKVATLIDMNRNIASGLLASLENAAKEASQQEEGAEAPEEVANAEAAATEEPQVVSVNHEA